MISLEHIDMVFGENTVNAPRVFDDFNLTVNNGEFVSVVGSNGSGKTTMLNIICGSIKNTAGRILINGDDITKKRDYFRYKKIGRVYQNPAMGTCP